MLYTSHAKVQTTQSKLNAIVWSLATNVLAEIFSARIIIIIAVASKLLIYDIITYSYLASVVCYFLLGNPLLESQEDRNVRQTSPADGNGHDNVVSRV